MTDVYPCRYGEQPDPKEPGREFGSAHGPASPGASGCGGLPGAEYLRHAALLLHIVRELPQHRRG